MNEPIDQADREKVANLCHDQWSGWMRYIFDPNCSKQNADGSITIAPWAVDRWKRQMKTAYADLSKEEKDSDRREADKFIGIFSES